MAQYILVDANNVVQNVIAYDGAKPYTPPTGQTLIAYTGQASIGWDWNGTAVVVPPLPPPPPVTVVTMLQARLAILQQTAIPNLMTNIQNAINGDTTGVLAAWWDYAPTVNINNAQLQQVATQIGLTQAQLQALFNAAAAIVVD